MTYNKKELLMVIDDYSFDDLINYIAIAQKKRAEVQNEINELVLKRNRIDEKLLSFNRIFRLKKEVGVANKNEK